MSENRTSITAWSALAPGLTSQPQWADWARGNLSVDFTQSTDFKAASIPAMTRRRCSLVTQLALETANQAVADTDIDYAVFCSQHGELQCSVGLLNQICQQEPLSPTQFSLSVHNSAAGLFSLLHAFRGNVNSLAAGENTFLMGITEAITWLEQHPQSTALLVMSDDYIPDAYQEQSITSNYQYATAFCLSNQTQQGMPLCLDEIKKQLSLTSTQPQALAFLAWLLREKSC